jgi:hypothetical protein
MAASATADDLGCQHRRRFDLDGRVIDRGIEE